MKLLGQPRVRPSRPNPVAGKARSRPHPQRRCHAPQLPSLRSHDALPASFCWLGVWGFLGLCLEGHKTISPRLRFVADAAYWIYLVHVPLVGLTQLLVHWADQDLPIRLPPILGFTLAVGFAFAVALASYRYGVRYGVIGKWLHGKKARNEAIHRAEVVVRLP